MGDQPSKALAHYEENVKSNMILKSSYEEQLLKSSSLPIELLVTPGKLFVQSKAQGEDTFTSSGVRIDDPFKFNKNEKKSTILSKNVKEFANFLQPMKERKSLCLKTQVLQARTCKKIMDDWKLLIEQQEIESDAWSLMQRTEQSIIDILKIKTKKIPNKQDIEIVKQDAIINKASTSSADTKSKSTKSKPMTTNNDLSSNIEKSSRPQSNEPHIQHKKSNSEGVENIPIENIRNFSIIAHVDHGKSTLADRLLEITGAVAADPGNKQVLDKLQVERERGITVKAQTASLFYNHKGEEYLLNLIDTPGHVDFANEVSRSVAACQGVILLVDANQGVQAQTVANYHLAAGRGLVVLPVLNKIDLVNANPDKVKEQLFNLFTIDPDDVLMISAKMGVGMNTLVDALVSRVPHPPGDRSAPFRALVFDSWFDQYRGAMALVYVRDGQVQLGDEICSAFTKKQYIVRGLGILRPQEEAVKKLVGGQVGCIVCNMRSVSEAHIGDTLHLKNSDVEPLSSFSAARPMIYAGVYPMDQSELIVLKNAIEKLSLNDPSVTVSNDSSPVLGNGWRIGFLGFLHLEVFNQRLEQEYGAEAIMTAPSVPYKVKVFGKKNITRYGGEEVIISDPTKFPEREIIAETQEPMVLGTIITPIEYLPKVMAECIERRGKQTSTVNLDETRVMLQFELPLNEIIVDFHDAIKASTSGFASFDYEEHGFCPSDLVKMDILMNGKAVDALSTIVHKSKAPAIGKRVCAKLAEILPRQQVEVAIQAAVGGKILARDNIKAYRKDVTAKLHGGDVTRKQKLLKKQAAGKKRMKQMINIDIPRDVFINFLKR